MEKQNYYDVETENVVSQLNTNIETGLTTEEVKARQEKHGLNAFAKEKKHNPFLTFIKNFIEPLIIVLLAVAILSFVINEWKEGVVIVVIVFINACISTYQEIKSQKTLDSLKKLSSPQVSVKRNNEIIVIDSSELVPGDIVLLDAGRFVPADIRIIEASHFFVDESALTGESVPALKHADLIKSDKSLALGDQENMAFMSTFITNGRAIGIVVKTGTSTEMGKISAMIAGTPNIKTPLQRKLAKITFIISIVAFVIAAAMFGIQLINSDWMPSLVSSITLAVAVIPESLPVIISVILAISVQKMAKRSAIVKKLPSVETLGSVNVICSDKTGTLTQNKMTVVEVISNNNIVKAENLNIKALENKELVQAMVLCNDSFIDSNENQIGDPTETALVAFGRKFGIKEIDLRDQYKRVDELPFDSSRKMMSSVNLIDNKQIVYTKGAIDNILTRSTHILLDGKRQVLTAAIKKEILLNASALSAKALRILGFAYKENTKGKELESELTFIGAVGMIDPARPEVAQAIEQARIAAIDVVMITGDHKDTAFAIAKDLGIASVVEEAITGAEVEAMSESELKEKIRSYKVFARVSPEHKVKIVQALQSHNLVVSMTGDGVNDAPSLKTANIGVAMGITGTDVSKDAADMILADDNFATIVNAVSEGRNIYKKIKKAIAFVFSTNIAEVFAIFAVLLATEHSPLGAVSVLWINLIVESIIAIPMSMDKNDPRVMHDKPRPIKESLFKYSWINIVFSIITTAAVVIGAYFIGESTNVEEAKTMAFFVMASAPMISAIVMRLDRLVLFTKNMWSNRNLLIAIALGLGLNFIAIYTPVSDLMELQSLSPVHMAIGLALIFTPAILYEGLKVARMIGNKFIKN